MARGKKHFPGDSACDEESLLTWLRDEKREGGPQGSIGFAVSARMNQAMHAEVAATPTAKEIARPRLRTAPVTSATWQSRLNEGKDPMACPRAGDDFLRSLLPVPRRRARGLLDRDVCKLGELSVSGSRLHLREAQYRPRQRSTGTSTSCQPCPRLRPAGSAPPSKPERAHSACRSGSPGARRPMDETVHRPPLRLPRT